MEANLSKHTMSSFTLYLTHKGAVLNAPIHDTQLATTIKTFLNIDINTPVIYANARNVLGNFDCAYGIFSKCPALYKKCFDTCGSLINTTGTHGSFLIKAIQEGDYDAFSRALRSGSSYIRAVDNDKQMMAIEWAVDTHDGDDAFIKALAPEYVYENVVPIVLAVRKGLPVSILELLKPRAVNLLRNDCIKQALKSNGSYALGVLDLFTKWGVSYKDPDGQSVSYVMEALDNPSDYTIDIIKRLVAGGSDLDFVSSGTRNFTKYCINALMFALRKKTSSSAVVKYLIRETTNMSLRNNLDDNVLHYAAFNYPRAVPWILASPRFTSVMLDVKRISGYDAPASTPTPLHMAASKGSYKAVRALLKAGADATIEGARGKTAIFHAIGSKSVKTVKAFADYLEQTWGQNKWTPLIDSINNGSLETTKALLKMGADVNGTCAHKWTSAIHAVRCNNYDQLALLAKHGADLMLECSVNFNVGAAVCRYGSLENIMHIYKTYDMKTSSNATGEYGLVLLNDKLSHKEKMKAIKRLDSVGIDGIDKVFCKDYLKFKSMDADMIVAFLELGASPNKLALLASDIEEDALRILFRRMLERASEHTKSTSNQ